MTISAYFGQHWLLGSKTGSRHAIGGHSTTLHNILPTLHVHDIHEANCQVSPSTKKRPALWHTVCSNFVGKDEVSHDAQQAPVMLDI